MGSLLALLAAHVEENIGGVGDDHRLCDRGDVAVVERVPVAVELVLRVGGVVSATHAPVVITHANQIIHRVHRL